MRNQKLSFLGVLVTHTFLNLASAPKVHWQEPKLPPSQSVYLLWSFRPPNGIPGALRQADGVMRAVDESMRGGADLVIGREMHGGVASHHERPTVTNSGTVVLRVTPWAAAFLHAW
jgi:hypothetical protein